MARPDVTLTWRGMLSQDLSRVQAIAAVVHPAYPESPQVFAERLALCPAGCLVLQDGRGELVGYAVSHPWHQAQPPALDSLLGALPPAASTCYLHDIALMPEARGRGAPSRLLALLLAQARAAGLDEVSLVAVNGSRAYWQSQGFEALEVPALAAKLRSYDADACLMRRRCA
jgi:ribosomal protein S18 acetylase RimI-like enzyme